MEFQPDYLVAWDISDKDHPTITVSRVHAEANSMTLTIDALDTFHSETGICSLRQILDKHEHDRRVEKEAFNCVKSEN